MVFYCINDYEWNVRLFFSFLFISVLLNILVLGAIQILHDTFFGWFNTPLPHVSFFDIPLYQPYPLLAWCDILICPKQYRRPSLFAGVTFHKNTANTKTRHLQHDTRILSCRIVGCIDENYDMSYTIGRMADLSFDTKRLSHICVVYSRFF